MVGILRVKAFRPTVDLYKERAIELLIEVVDSGRLSHGELVRLAEMRVSGRHGFRYAVGTSGAGPAMLAALAYYRDEFNARRVAVQGLGYGAAVYAALLLGYEVVLVDASRDAMVADLGCLERAAKDADVVVVGMLGGFWYPEYLREAARLVPRVLVDGAQAYGVAESVGGADVVLSFHSAKPIGAGEGGMLLTSDAGLDFYARAARDYGMIGRTHAQWGFNLAMTELQAAFIVAGDEAWDRVERAFRLVWDAYSEGLGELLYTAAVGLEYRFNGLQNMLVLPEETVRRGVTEKEVRMRLWEEYGIEPWGTSALNLAGQRAFKGRVRLACGDSNSELWYRRHVVLPNVWYNVDLAGYVSRAVREVVAALGG